MLPRRELLLPQSGRSSQNTAEKKKGAEAKKKAAAAKKTAADKKKAAAAKKKIAADKKKAAAAKKKKTAKKKVTKKKVAKKAAKKKVTKKAAKKTAKEEGGEKAVKTPRREGGEKAAKKTAKKAAKKKGGKKTRWWIAPTRRSPLGGKGIRSQWQDIPNGAGIKHKKHNDAKHGKIFSKLAKLITVAARIMAGAMIDPHLKLVVDKGKAANMPNDNIDRAIKKGLEGSLRPPYPELVYEGYS